MIAVAIDQTLAPCRLLLGPAFRYHFTSWSSPCWKWDDFFFFFFEMKNCSSERLSDFAKFSQLASGRTGIRTQKSLASKSGTCQECYCGAVHPRLGTRLQTRTNRLHWWSRWQRWLGGLLPSPFQPLRLGQARMHSHRLQAAIG